MVQYDLILFLDGDSVLMRCLDGILSAPAESRIAPVACPGGFWGWDTLNTGFMILQPSLKMFHYFEALLGVQDSFDTSIADQSVLNVALSREGPTPWTAVDFSWNIQWPWPEDIKAGYAVLYEKWWAPTHWESKDYFLSWYWRMIGYYSASD
ncbi:hypothetical protein N7471_008785 [Penicillium samsonianum]|uniref:uncharacterized protein n=1 Tax=Penicillium samsonianum TaxID=1882272 RepID=UPI002546ACE8|nr:uncharacterized protein N7471_008785 [Penicillium samsonianum]KAJ6133570.1 hypothetical protein N7471_008785 [Penicillium samsonianum]